MQKRQRNQLPSSNFWHHVHTTVKLVNVKTLFSLCYGILFKQIDVVNYFNMVNYCLWLSDMLCLNSGSASFRGAFEGQLRHYAAQRLSQSEGSFKCSPQMRPSFPCFWGMHSYCPLRPHILLPRFFVHPKLFYLGLDQREVFITAKSINTYTC